MTKRAIIDCETGEMVVRDMTEAEEAEHAAYCAEAESAAAAPAARAAPRDLAGELDELRAKVAQLEAKG